MMTKTEVNSLRYFFLITSIFSVSFYPAVIQEKYYSLKLNELTIFCHLCNYMHWIGKFPYFFYKQKRFFRQTNPLTRPTHPLFKVGCFWLYIMFLMRNFSVERSDANLSDMVLVLAINHVFSLFLMRNLSVERSDAKANHTFCHCFMRKAM